ncbi:MAG: hypothetical protein AB7G39_05405 [Alphaproteobacteria bacterium]
MPFRDINLFQFDDKSLHEFVAAHQALLGQVIDGRPELIPPPLREDFRTALRVAKLDYAKLVATLEALDDTQWARIEAQGLRGSLLHLKVNAAKHFNARWAENPDTDMAALRRTLAAADIVMAALAQALGIGERPRQIALDLALAVGAGD